MIRALIVDDEAIARRRLRRLLTDAADLSVIGEAGSAEDGRALIAERRPHLVFVDVEMPGATGLSLLADPRDGHSPLFVVVTAHAQYAVDAFNGAALDYVLKPVRRERALEATRRAIAQIRLQQRESAGAGYSSIRRVVVSVGRRLIPIEPAAIEWVQADENYVWISGPLGRFVHRATLGQILAQLPSADFVQVHRSIIVRLSSLRALTTDDSGGGVIELESGARVPCSRRYRATLMQRLRGEP